VQAGALLAKECLVKVVADDAVRLAGQGQDEDLAIE
jgi:hypothetical protein